MFNVMTISNRKKKLFAKSVTLSKICSKVFFTSYALFRRTVDGWKEIQNHKAKTSYEAILFVIILFCVCVLFF